MTSPRAAPDRPQYLLPSLRENEPRADPHVRCDEMAFFLGLFLIHGRAASQQAALARSKWQADRRRVLLAAGRGCAPDAAGRPAARSGRSRPGSIGSKPDVTGGSTCGLGRGVPLGFSAGQGKTLSGKPCGINMNTINKHTYITYHSNVLHNRI